MYKWLTSHVFNDALCSSVNQFALCLQKILQQWMKTKVIERRMKYIPVSVWYQYWENKHCNFLVTCYFFSLKDKFHSWRMPSWDITPCGSCKNWRFGGMYRLHHQCDKNRRARNNVNSNYQPKHKRSASIKPVTEKNIGLTSTVRTVIRNFIDQH
jgi:hypothetical protein